MHLSEVRVQHFRSLTDVTAHLGKGLNVLVGRNNVGKSNLLDAIRNARTIDFKTFITSLGIRHVGEEIAELYACTFDDLDTLMTAPYETLVGIHGVGTQIADATIAYFTNTENKAELKRLCKVITIHYGRSDTTLNNLNGYSFVVTGTLNTMSRDEVHAAIKHRGGKVLKQISNTVDYLVIGEKPGSKVDKAKELNIPVLTESDFINTFLTD